MTEKIEKLARRLLLILGIPFILACMWIVGNNIYQNRKQGKTYQQIFTQ